MMPLAYIMLFEQEYVSPQTSKLPEQIVSRKLRSVRGRGTRFHDGASCPGCCADTRRALGKAEAPPSVTDIPHSRG